MGTDHPGLGVMIQKLFGFGDSAEVFKAAVGKVIESVILADDALHFVFTDGSKMKMYDNGQSCCESRYMRTDDDLADFAGAKFTGAEIKDAPDIEDGGESHEVQFLEIQTDKGCLTMSNHNEHNGYYGGFAVVCEAE